MGFVVRIATLAELIHLRSGLAIKVGIANGIGMPHATMQHGALHGRALANRVIPALHIREIVQRLPLPSVVHYPRPGSHIGDGVIVSDEFPVL